MLTGLGVALVLATAATTWRHPAWWVRVCDFPRVQIAAALAIVLALHATRVEAGGPGLLLRVLLGLALALQVWRMLPYTRLWPAQVQPARRRAAEGRAADDPRALTLLFANVLQTNRDGERLLALVQRTLPDVFLALETDAWWLERLRPLLAQYPHQVLQPQDNTYGLLLLSRLPLLEPELRFLVQDDVPSVHARLRLRCGAEIALHALHPRPPSPTEAPSARARDAELLVVGRAIRATPGPAVVLGDMNDVAWSHTSRLFRRISGLLDPRIGRGFFNTFHAGLWWLRFPLDHVFFSSEFRLVDFHRGPFFGSDHFPVCVHLRYEPEGADAQDEPTPSPDDRQEAQQKIAEGLARPDA